MEKFGQNLSIQILWKNITSRDWFMLFCNLELRQTWFPFKRGYVGAPIGFSLIINKLSFSPFLLITGAEFLRGSQKFHQDFSWHIFILGQNFWVNSKISPKVSPQQAVCLQRRLNDSSTFQSDVVKSQPMPWSKIRHQLLLNDNFKIFESFCFYYYYFFSPFPFFLWKKVDARRGVDGKPKEHAAPNYGYRSTFPRLN